MNDMKRTYFAVVHEKNGEYYPIEFPDVPECVTQGRDMEEVQRMAKDALMLILEEGYDKQGKPYPNATNQPDELLSKVDKEMGPVAFAMPVTVYLSNKPMRINITSTTSKIAEITAFAKRVKRTRSELMVNATLDYIRANAFA